jgi:hypothetical protein
MAHVRPPMPAPTMQTRSDLLWFILSSAMVQDDIFVRDWLANYLSTSPNIDLCLLSFPPALKTVHGASAL